MKRALVAGFLVPFLLLAGSVAIAEPPRKVSPQNKEREWVVGEAIIHGNLSIFPVSSRTPKEEDRFLTLAEGLKAGTVEVSELGANQAPGNDRQTPRQPSQAGNRVRQANEADNVSNSGNEVNTLLVVNKSKQPLYLMPGEILLGGDQDRAVAQEVVIAPGQKPVPIAVYCVEHGRWGRRDPQELRAYLQEATANAAAAESVALATGGAGDAVKQANSGKFIGSLGSLSKKGRVAVQGAKNQGRVWDEVAEENDKGGVKSKSGAFTGNYAEAEAVKRLEPYLEKLQKPVAGTKNVLGVIVAINGKMESTDVFESTPLFKKLWPQLLKSYALDAANTPPTKTSKASQREDAQAFFDEVVQSGVKTSETTTGAATTHSETEKVLVFSARQHDTAASASPARPLAGFSDAIHAAGFAK